MASRQLKRNKTRSEQSPIKRQKSKPVFDDTDGRIDSIYTPENNPSVNGFHGDRDSVVRKNLFTGGSLNSNDVPRNGGELINTGTNCTDEPETVVPMNVDVDMTPASDSEDYCSKSELTNMPSSQRIDFQNNRGQYSAGANIGHFQMKYNTRSSVSQTQISSSPHSTEIRSGHGDSVDYCLKRELTNTNPSQPIGFQNKKKSAGANIGHFQMKCKKGSNVSHTQSSSSPYNTEMINDHGIDTDRHNKRRSTYCKQRTSERQIYVRRPCGRGRRVKKSDLETDDLDMDIIYATNIKTDVIDSIPNDVPPGFARVPIQTSPGASGCWMRAISPRTDTSQLYIQHTQATDDPVLGDKFGASVETTKKRIDGYYRHIIRHEDVNGVADNMHIEDGDELVLINESFVPELDHKTVLQLFSDVPVDQHTRFALVLRRPLKDGRWEWVTTSAILVPELEKPPEVRELKFERDKGHMKLFQHWYRIQIDGTQMYLIISGGEIRVQVASGDPKDYNICVMSKLAVDPSSGDTSYYACLFGVHHEDKLKNNYLHVNGTGEIGLDREPQWFGYGRKGKKMIIKVQELQKYIGCLVYNYGTTGHLCIQDDEYDKFDANSLETSYDHPDTGADCLSQPSSKRSSASEPLSLRLSGVSDTSRSSFSSSNNGSLEDIGYGGGSSSKQTKCEGSRPFESPISDSGSSQYFSVNSGSCGTPNTPMAGLSLFSTQDT